MDEVETAKRFLIELEKRIAIFMAAKVSLDSFVISWCGLVLCSNGRLCFCILGENTTSANATQGPLVQFIPRYQTVLQYRASVRPQTFLSRLLEYLHYVIGSAHLLDRPGWVTRMIDWLATSF